jgi:hypothetical protein
MGNRARTAAVLVALLLVILPAFAIHLPWKPLGLAPGVRFASVGMDRQYSTMDSIGGSEPSRWSHFEPSLEVGIMVSRRIAVGGWLTTLGAFPKQGSLLWNTPDFSFGAAANYLLPIGKWVCACGGVKVGLTSLSPAVLARRVGFSAGLFAGNLGPVGIGLEGNALWDVLTLQMSDVDRTIVARTISVGLRIQGSSR